MSTNQWLTVNDAPVYSAYVAHNPPVFKRILDLYVPHGATVADVTYGRGTFWKDVPDGSYNVLATDIRTGTDCRALPYDDASVDCLVLDPPYMEGLFRKAHQTAVNHGDFRERYSQALPVEDKDGPKYHLAVLTLYLAAMREAARVLRRRGLLIVKCQDEVSNHRQWVTHVEILNAAGEMGLRVEDLVIVVRPDRPSVGRIKHQEHARKRHSYFLVLRSLGDRAGKAGTVSEEELDDVPPWPEYMDQLRADLETARAEIERLKSENENLETLRQGQRDRIDFEVGRYAQSRANEAELRAVAEALKKRLPTPECRLDEWFSGGCPCDCHPAAKAALDAEEPRT